ncbi:NAD(P)-dependent oxidoreductase [Streptomyces boluensis]|uniref:NAD(P)-binding domain-containing protein n=1 Tax=Streptomyces boluensis TaxID=1775135 RepID=A0A964UTJ6_9ACTN|nr:NAD(P)-binding domain-containing protein [Streptomyces boluensis]NBE55129.1 NAD(P)-binding domain-containing protein [Streptomyces boluensis]
MSRTTADPTATPPESVTGAVTDTDTATGTATETAADTGAVTVLGLGQLGTTLARAFLAAGHATTVWNRSPRKAGSLVAEGAAAAASLTGALAAGPLVVIAVSDYAAVRELLEPVADRLRGKVLVNLTSGTPEQARAEAAWAGQHGAAYLDGAAMSGTRIVGTPEALFVFSGAPEVFEARRGVLAALGNALLVGPDAGAAAVYDTALFGLAWGALAGFHHAVALTGAEGVDPVAFATVAAGHMPFVTGLMVTHADHVATGRYPDDDGTVDVHAAALEHLAESSRVRGIGTELPDMVRALLARASAAGHGADGIAAVAEAFHTAQEQNHA